MKAWRAVGATVLLAVVLAVGCSGSDASGTTEGSAASSGTGGSAGGSGADASAEGSDQDGASGGSTNDGAGGSMNDGAGGTAGWGQSDGGCVVTQCQAHVYQCGDCLDNDNDGLIDMYDPDCLGPCHNNEKGFDLQIPGGGNAPCKLDCYFDQDTGSGNDNCYWNHECDSYEVTPDYYPEPGCPYNPNAKTPGTNKSCAELDQSQSQQCHDFCGPLTPNGCDCFGCCELPPGGGNYVWLGSTVGGVGTCDLDHMTDPTKCHPCHPVADCLNTCQHCELCLGKTELPADCTTPQPDGGGGSGGSPGDDSGSGGTGGGPGCGGQICPVGSDPCGLSCQPPCPAGYFCLTGCCQKAPA